MEKPRRYFAMQAQFSGLIKFEKASRSEEGVNASYMIAFISRANGYMQRCWTAKPKSHQKL